MKKLKITFVTIIILVIGYSIFSRFLNYRQTTAHYSRCERNLLIIGLCKAGLNDQSTNRIITWEDLKPDLTQFAKDNGWTNWIPVCPDGGTYNIGKMGEKPICSIGGKGHSLGN
jgi:hypothetical protein